VHSKPPRRKKGSADAEDLLREHRHLTFLVENSPLAVIEYDHEFRIRRWSAQAEKLFGWKAEEAMGKHNLEMHLVHKSERSKVSAAIQRLMERHEPRNVVRNRNRRKNGSIVLCEWYNSARLDDLGKVASILSLVQDISNQEQSFMERTVAMVSETERQRIGLELHDVLAQQLAGLAFLSKAFEVKLSAQMPGFSAQAAQLAQLAQLASEAVLQVRNLSSGLYPAELERRGLVAALRELALGQEQIYQKSCTFRHTGLSPTIDPAVSLNLFRIMQEALTNAMKHSHAAQVTIHLHATKKELYLIVSDDGRGFAPAMAQSDGKGIRIMNYRSESIGAHLLIEAAKPHGTVVTCTVQLNPDFTQ